MNHTEASPASPHAQEDATETHTIETPHDIAAAREAHTSDFSPRASQTSRTIEEPTVMPQWVFDFVIRPGFGSFLRVMCRIRFRGLENIPARGGVILAANHQTYLDPFLLSIMLKRPTRYLAWNEAFNWKLTGKFMYLFGALPIQLEGGDRTATRRSQDWLAKDGALVIFPEGGRGNPDGSLMRLKSGTARLALDAGVPILPVSLRGAHRLWNRTQKLPRPVPLEITYHPLIHVQLESGEDERAAARRVTDDLAVIINSAL